MILPWSWSAYLTHHRLQSDSDPEPSQQQQVWNYEWGITCSSTWPWPSGRILWLGSWQLSGDTVIQGVCFKSLISGSDTLASQDGAQLSNRESNSIVMLQQCGNNRTSDIFCAYCPNVSGMFICKNWQFLVHWFLPILAIFDIYLSSIEKTALVAKLPFWQSLTPVSL